MPITTGDHGMLSDLPTTMETMSERLVNLHLIETGVRGFDALFEVSLLLDDHARDGLRNGDRTAWQGTVRRARKLIDDHVSERRAAEGLF
jgi:hypothetical protein